jgi:sigma-E factor negative regulatory protein RseA
MQAQEESFSALVDGESDGPAGPRITRLLNDEASRDRWARYHLIGDVLRDSAAPLAPDLRHRISAAIDAEPALLAPAARQEAPPTVTPARAVRHLAVAASLAAVGVLGVMLVARAPSQPPPATLAQAPVAPATLLPVPSAAQPQVVRWDEGGTPSSANPQTIEFERRLNSYLVNFNEQRANVGVPSVHPYVRIVGSETGSEQP